MKKEKEIKCNRCGSGVFIYVGWDWRKGVKNIHRHRCKACGKVYTLPDDMLVIDEKEYNNRKEKKEKMEGK